MSGSFVIAAAQSAPVYLDRDASVEKACRLIAEAGKKGADLVAFGETWLPGYPFFAFAGPSTARWDATQEYLAQAVQIPGPDIDQICSAARAADTDVVIGVAELDPRTRGTVYCTMLAIGREGRILGGHRKLKPTMDERTVWGEGSGDDLYVYDRPYGRMSALNCWEHQMVLPGYALMAQGTQVHVAGWPGGDPETPPKPPISLWARQELLSRAFAAHGACYVVAVGGPLIVATVDFDVIVTDTAEDGVLTDPGDDPVVTAEVRGNTCHRLKHAAAGGVVNAAAVAEH